MKGDPGTGLFSTRKRLWIFWKSFAAREIVAWPSDYSESESISEQSQGFWWLQNKYRRNVNHQKTAPPNPSPGVGPSSPRNLFLWAMEKWSHSTRPRCKCHSESISPSRYGMYRLPFISAMLDLLSALRIRLQNLQESTACSPTGCVNLRCLSFHAGTSIPETCCQGSLIYTWKVGRAMCTLTSTSHLTSLFQFSRDQEETPNEKADDVLEPTCPQDCVWDEASA